jgi:hypothetical protein
VPDARLILTDEEIIEYKKMKYKGINEIAAVFKKEKYKYAKEDLLQEL